MPKTLQQMWALLERPRARRAEEYYSLCLQLDDIAGAEHSARLRDALAIVELDEPQKTRVLLQEQRKREAIPRARFWWWLDYLQNGKL